uniref:ScMYB71 protein n=1 Tax=Saccharum hybrid cultivar Co 86032 TaxID=672234 RepID=A0A0C6WCS4_9POAL|nr:ScMYB71 protein [Saccharum hybrid cultivar Co 86032]
MRQGYALAARASKELVIQRVVGCGPPLAPRRCRTFRCAAAAPAPCRAPGWPRRRRRPSAAPRCRAPALPHLRAVPVAAVAGALPVAQVLRHVQQRCCSRPRTRRPATPCRRRSRRTGRRTMPPHPGRSRSWSPGTGRTRPAASAAACSGRGRRRRRRCRLLRAYGRGPERPAPPHRPPRRRPRRLACVWPGRCRAAGASS